MAQQTENYNPYCPICESCGEELCCSPLSCEQSIEGHYCQGYLRDLRFGYAMNKYFEEKICGRMTENLKKEYDDEWDKQYDIYYKNK